MSHIVPADNNSVCKTTSIAEINTMHPPVAAETRNPVFAPPTSPKSTSFRLAFQNKALLQQRNFIKFLNNSKVCVILPEKKWYFDLLIFILCCVTVITTPLAIAFDINFPHEFVLSIFFMIDTILTFFTARILEDCHDRIDEEIAHEMGIDNKKSYILQTEEGKYYTTDRQKIFMGYAEDKTGLIFDILCFADWGRLFVDNNSTLCCSGRLNVRFIFDLLLFARLARFKRVYHTVKPAVRWIRSNSPVSGIIEVLSYFLLACHYLGCFFFFVSSVESAVTGGLGSFGTNFTGVPWVAQESAGVCDASIQNCGVTGAGIMVSANMAGKATQYITVLYFAVTTLSTVGFGDVAPVTNIERLFFIFIYLIGIIFYASILGAITVYLDAVNYNSKIRKEFFGSFGMFLRRNKKSLPKVFCDKMKRYATVQWRRKSASNRLTMICNKYLPYHMHSRLRIQMYRVFVARADIFKNAPVGVIQNIVRCIQPGMCIAGDYIFRVDEHGTEMYMLHSGCVDVTSKENQHIATLPAGSFFGEISLIVEQPRSATVRAKTNCEYFVLTNASFKKTLALYTEWGKRFKADVISRLDSGSQADEISKLLRANCLSLSQKR